MAVIDGLLKLIAARGADSLELVAGEVPELAKGGAPMRLSMPELDQAFVEQLVAEVAPDVALAGEAEAHVGYAIASSGARFSIRLRRRGGVLSLSARAGDHDGKAVPPATAAPVVAAPVVAAPATSKAAPGAPSAPRAQPSPQLEQLLRQVEQADASDLLLSSGLNARLRVGSELVELPQVFDEAQILALVALDEGALATLSARGSVDRTLDRRAAGGSRYRVNVFRQHHGIAAALRPIRRQIPTLEQLRLPADFSELVERPHGMVLMAGPAGSGKSTTIAALVEHINRSRACHVITLEDPIEYEYVSRRALIHQREVGRDLHDFSSGLRAALRESPDLIVVGEMRDAETMAAALTAAETGHLVLSTLHAPSGADAVDRIIDTFAPHQQRQVRNQLAAILRAVVTQHLVPATSRDGRVVVYERMVVNRAIAAMIRDDKCHQIRSQLQTGRDQGMISLDQCLARRLAAGEISRESALALADDREMVTSSGR